MIEFEYTPEETFALPFSIERHKKTFVNYTELVIDKDGNIMYATPSHERKMMSIILQNNPEMCERDLMQEAEESGGLYDWINWLMRKSECMCIYTCGIAYADPSTQKQMEKVKQLVDAGLTVMDKIPM